MAETAKDELRFLNSPEYARRRKQFVEVIAAHKLDGSVCPKTVIFADGRQFDIDMYRAPIPAVISDSREHVTVYPIRRDDGSANAEKSYLFESESRWYVLMKT